VKSVIRHTVEEAFPADVQQIKALYTISNMVVLRKYQVQRMMHHKYQFPGDVKDGGHTNEQWRVSRTFVKTWQNDLTCGFAEQSFRRQGKSSDLPGTL